MSTNHILPVLFAATTLVLGGARPGRGQSKSSVTPTAPADVQITMREYSFDMDSTLARGAHVLVIRNIGHQGHLAILVRLADERSSRDVISWLEHRSDSAPGDVVVTTPEVKPGDSTLVTVSLSPGRYAFVCPVRGWWNRPHYKSGMSRDIVVR